MFSINITSGLPQLLDFDTICRVCLKKGKLQSIFEYRSVLKPQLDMDLSQKMRLCSGLEIAIDDCLPSSICETCFGLLCNAYKFKVLIEDSVKKLKNVLKSEELNSVLSIKRENLISNSATIESRQMKTNLGNSGNSNETVSNLKIECSNQFHFEEDLEFSSENDIHNRILDKMECESDFSDIIDDILQYDEQNFIQCDYFQSKNDEKKVNLPSESNEATNDPKLQAKKNVARSKLEANGLGDDCKLKIEQNFKDLNIKLTKKKTNEKRLKKKSKRKFSHFSGDEIVSSYDNNINQDCGLLVKINISEYNPVRLKDSCKGYEDISNCDGDNQSFDDEEYSETHMQFGKHINVCPICDKAIGGKNDKLQCHIATMHFSEVKAEFQCYGCNKKFSSRWDRELHEDLNCSKILPGMEYKCRLCGATAVSRNAFDRHIWREHRGGRMPPPKRPPAITNGMHMCEKCGKVCLSRYNYDRHMLKHGIGFTPPKENIQPGFPDNLLCKICGEVSPSTSEHALHKRQHATGMLNRTNLVCEKCDYSTFNSESMSVHRLRHAGLKPFACGSCSFRTDRKNYLKDHMRSHSKEKKYACAICEYRSVKLCYLKKHQTTHSNIGTFECNECSKFYKCKKSLDKHNLKIHKGLEVPFCRSCKSSFLGEDAYIKHVQEKHSTQIEN